jgi:hypothetical protein
LRSLGPLLSPFLYSFRFLVSLPLPLPRPTDLIKIINEITLKLARAQAPGDDTLFAQSRVNNGFLLIVKLSQNNRFNHHLTQIQMNF